MLIQVQVLYKIDGKHKMKEVPVRLPPDYTNENGIFPGWLNEALSCVIREEGWNAERITSFHGHILRIEE